MSSPTTGFLSLIRFDSGQDRTVRLNNIRLPHVLDPAVHPSFLEVLGAFICLDEHFVLDLYFAKS